MLELDEETVDLTVTSPYYRNAIDYDEHLKNKYYRSKKKQLTTDEYVTEMSTHFEEVFRVSKNGSYCCVVIGNELAEGKLVSLPSYFILLMEKLGFVLQDEIIWYKVTGGKKRFRVTVQHPNPTYYYPNILHEKILIFRKGDVVHKKNCEFKLDDYMKKEVANSVWHIAPVPPNKYEHPCPFPEELAYRLIMLYSCPNDLILDNFNGIGTTTKVAYLTNRNTTGYDIRKKYCNIAKRRLMEKLNLRDLLIPKWEKIER